MKNKIKIAQNISNRQQELYNVTQGNQADYRLNDLVQVKDTTIHPYNSIGKIKCNIYDNNKKFIAQSLGTGTIIGQRLVITSAHVISIIRNRKALISDQIQFYPGNSFIAIKVIDYWINPNYFNALYFQNALYDFAILQLQPNKIIKKNHSIKIRFDYAFEMNKKLINVTGYPKDQMTQYQAEGKAVKQEDGLLFYKNTTYSGNSGGPVLLKVNEKKYQLIGVHKGNLHNHNYCVLINALKKSSQQISQLIQNHGLQNQLKQIYKPSSKRIIQKMSQRIIILQLQNQKLKENKIKKQKQDNKDKQPYHYYQLKNNKIQQIYQSKLIQSKMQIKQFQSQKQQKKQIKINKNLYLDNIPKNFRFYRFINLLRQSQYNISTEQIIEFMRKNIIQFKDFKFFQKRKINQQLDPILLYTQPIIYAFLNKCLRQQNYLPIKLQHITKNNWHYYFSQKLLKRLMELPNYIGPIFRASHSLDYGYRVGNIFQWNNFSSFSARLSVTQKFLFAQNKQFSYLFEIRSSSGKQIPSFAFYQDQRQVIILPYTKFEVIQVQQKISFIKNKEYKYKYVKMQQIPIPKQIKGNIIIWIDGNIEQNYKTYTKIIETNKYQNFQLIQLSSNQVLKRWINQNQYIFSLQEVKIYFISNMNRSPQYKKEGIQTLQIVRKYLSQRKFIYYVENKQECISSLQLSQASSYKNIQIITHILELNNFFKQISIQ